MASLRPASSAKPGRADERCLDVDPARTARRRGGPTTDIASQRTRPPVISTVIPGDPASSVAMPEAVGDDRQLAPAALLAETARDRPARSVVLRP